MEICSQMRSPPLSRCPICISFKNLRTDLTPNLSKGTTIRRIFNKIQIKTPNLLFLSFVHITCLVECVNQLKCLITDKIIISIKINDNVTILTDLCIGKMSIVQSIAFVGLYYYICFIF